MIVGSRMKHICPPLRYLLFLVKLNGGRSIQGILRGFDPFMNLVIDEGIGKRKDGSEENIGMVVSEITRHHGIIEN